MKREASWVRQLRNYYPTESVVITPDHHLPSVPVPHGLGLLGVEESLVVKPAADKSATLRLLHTAPRPVCDKENCVSLF